MFLVDGGVGGTVGGSIPKEPTYTGTQQLRIEPSAIPGALAAFREAYDRVTRKVSELGGLPITRWAGDPVSAETAKLFGDRTNGGGADSALECLLGYQRQLENAIDSLERTEQAYLETEGTNTERWGNYA
ncbi:hypothetical protein [Actinophytocola xinjiangensis]|uniref:hypothetical protein n=1 Tax=Actinophytocola xinjiangensis TaxID=485602 RepID=UPI000A0665F1|nr:hypothetical protein [Actinophytocola xinjiangensis]